MAENTKILKQKLFKLQRNMESMQASMESNFAEIRVSGIR